MPVTPIIQDCIDATGLPAAQIEAAVGLVLVKLRDQVSQAEFDQIRTLLPEAETWMRQAPAPKKSLLGGLAGAVGGGRAKLLAELSQGLSRIGIPASLHRPLADALLNSVDRHCPELRELVENL